jgi:hypothetical protein
VCRVEAAHKRHARTLASRTVGRCALRTARRGTFPRDDITWDEPVSSFQGCDAALLDGARRLLMMTYIFLGLALLPVCLVCCTLFAAVAGASVVDPPVGSRAPRDMV